MNETVFDVITDRQAWAALALRLKSVYAHPGFVGRQAEFMGTAAQLYVLEHSSGAVIAYPFFIRPLRGLPFASSTQAALSDILTPIYTGPLCDATDPLVRAELGAAFRNCFGAYCRSAGIVAEFGHLNPWQACREALIDEDVQTNREIVYIDLTASEDELWHHTFTRECRKKIRQAKDVADLRVFQANEPCHAAEFARVYGMTMEHYAAQQHYRYSADYFQSLLERIGDQGALLLAAYQEQIIAGVVLAVDRVHTYSYLSGIDRNYREINGNNLLFYHAILWAKARGCTRMILGAGYRPDDGTYQFKKSFSSLRAQFQVYKHIHLPAEYAAICRAWSDYYQCDQPAAGYFPAYRSIPCTKESVES